jgi:hypothetical protein
VAGTDVGSANATPARVIPEVGQVAEYGSECPQSALTFVSQTPRAGFQVAIRLGTEQPPHILDDDVLRLQLIDGAAHFGPEPGARYASDQASAPTCQRHVSAWEPSGEDVDLAAPWCPVDSAHVAEVRYVWVVMSEDPARPRLNIGHERERQAEHLLGGDVESSVPAE